jgi:hypothetical protein
MPRKRLSSADLEAQEAKAKERAQAANRQLKRVQAQKRKAAQHATAERRRHWAAMAERVGLFDLPDDTLHAVLSLAYAILQKHHGHAPINGVGITEFYGVDLPILTEETDPSLGAKSPHAVSVEAGAEKAKATTLIRFSEKRGATSDQTPVEIG